MLRSLFGPSRKAIWRQLSAEIEGRYVEGGFCRGDAVQATHGEWTVTLDTYVVSTGKTFHEYTRMRAPYVNPDGFRFTIYRRTLFSDIAKWFGMQDIVTHDEPFDTDFIIKGTNEARVRELLSDAAIRELLARQPDIYFTVKDDEGVFRHRFPDGVDELYFSVPGVIKDIDRLKLLFELFAATLDRLCHIGSVRHAASHSADLKPRPQVLFFELFPFFMTIVALVVFAVLIVQHRGSSNDES